jgi:hypothetical protein
MVEKYTRRTFEIRIIAMDTKQNKIICTGKITYFIPSREEMLKHLGGAVKPAFKKYIAEPQI